MQNSKTKTIEYYDAKANPKSSHYGWFTLSLREVAHL